MIVQCAFLVNRFFDDAPVCYYGHCPTAYFQGVEAAVLLRPFCEPGKWVRSINHDAIPEGWYEVRFKTHFMCVYDLGIWCKLPMKGSVGGPVGGQCTNLGRPSIPKITDLWAYSMCDGHR